MPTDLIRIIRKALSAEDFAVLRGETRAATDEDYDAMIRRVGARLAPVEADFGKARTRAAERYGELGDLPVEWRETILESSPPEMLLVFFHDLVRQSWDERFGDVERSLRLAGVAIEVLEEVEKTGWLSRPDLEDLGAKAFTYLGNARRINSDLLGAERALQRSKRHLDESTGDRELEADYLRALVALRVSQSRIEDAVRLLDRQIALRRLLGDPEKLGPALVERGWVVLFDASVEEICAFFNEGVALLSEPRAVLTALHALVERLAREGHGIDAWAALSAARGPLSLLRSKRSENLHLWLKGLTHRALGDLETAGQELTAVHDRLVEEEGGFRLAIAALDLASIRIAQRRFPEVQALVHEAYGIFMSIGLGHRALEAVLMLREAQEAEHLTEAMAVEAVNFLVRYQHNKALRFAWPTPVPTRPDGRAELQT